MPTYFPEFNSLANYSNAIYISSPLGDLEGALTPYMCSFDTTLKCGVDSE